MHAWIPVVSWSLYFWTSAFSFRADSILKSGGDFISNWKFPDCVHFFGAWARQAVIETIAVVYQHTKRTQEMCSPIGHNNTMHFLCPIRNRHPLECLEMVRWESVLKGSFALTWKLSSRLFSRLDWLPLSLRGCARPRRGGQEIVETTCENSYIHFNLQFVAKAALICESVRSLN